jgi:hypothetical protein
MLKGIANFYYTFQIYPDMFQQVTAIFRELHMRYKLLQYCPQNRIININTSSRQNKYVCVCAWGEKVKNGVLKSQYNINKLETQDAQSNYQDNFLCVLIRYKHFGRM